MSAQQTPATQASASPRLARLSLHDPALAGGRRTHLDAMVLDATLRQALVVVRGLGRAGLAAGAFDCMPDAPVFASRWCRVSGVLPDFALDQDAFVDALLEVLDAYPARVLINGHDGSIEAMRARRADIERRTTLALGSEAALDIAVSKEKTLHLAEELGIAIPRSVAVTRLEDVPAALAEIGVPAVVKPLQSWVERDGVGTRLIVGVAHNADEAKTTVERVLAAGGSVILQEWLPGSREAISLLYARGKVWARFAQVAHRTLPPLGGSSVLRESIPLPADATDAAERLIRAIDLEGYSEIEFRRDGAGRPVLMEINPRLSASVEMALRAGIPFPELVYAWAAGEELHEVNGYRSGMRMRWLGGDLRQLKWMWNAQGQVDIVPKGRALRTFCLDFLRPTAYDYLDKHDLAPAAVATRQSLTRSLSHIVGRP